MKFLLVDCQDERVGMEGPVEFVDEDGEPADLIVQRVCHLALKREMAENKFIISYSIEGILQNIISN